MYDRETVDFTLDEHDQAEKLNGAIEGTIKAFDDGFQPLQDIDDIVGLGWAVADVIRTSSADFFERYGRAPNAAEIGEYVGTYFLMLRRAETF